MIRRGGGGAQEHQEACSPQNITPDDCKSHALASTCMQIKHLHETSVVC